ncbi:MAG: hypothetical protein ACRD3W_10640, partial [Terriglobales bacterium]
MELTAVLVVPIIASALSLLPLGRRFGAPITVVATLIVLGLATSTAVTVTRSGPVNSLDQW